LKKGVVAMASEENPNLAMYLRTLRLVTAASEARQDRWRTDGVASAKQGLQQCVEALESIGQQHALVQHRTDGFQEIVALNIDQSQKTGLVLYRGGILSFTLTASGMVAVRRRHHGIVSPKQAVNQLVKMLDPLDEIYDPALYEDEAYAFLQWHAEHILLSDCGSYSLTEETDAAADHFPTGTVHSPVKTT
jgi:hypothetical protein